MILSDDEKRWRAESDARTLADAEAIRNDPVRVGSAMEAAKRMAAERAKEASAMMKVAGRAKAANALEKKVNNGAPKFKFQELG